MNLLAEVGVQGNAGQTALNIKRAREIRPTP